MSYNDHHKPAEGTPSFHDGYLTAISVQAGAATLGLARSSGEAFELKLEGVEALHADDFRQGNIIYNLNIICGSVPDGVDLKERLERLFPSPHPNAASIYHERHTKFLADVLTRLADGSATMLIMEFSYGCDLVAICREIELTMLGTYTEPAG